VGLSRSEQMARIRGKDTRPELLLRGALRALGLRYRLNVKTAAARVDLVMVAAPIRVAIFIDGCFWHGCPDHYVPPRSRIQFWSTKLASNVARDHRQTVAIENEGCLPVPRFRTHSTVWSGPWRPTQPRLRPR
jgi:DNA mismatch endonuclease, patch repair protein